MMERTDEGGALTTPTDVGRMFLLQYYKRWSENPGSVFHFYGTDSFFQHDEVEGVGQANIQKAIETLNYENCKTRIHSVVGCCGISDSVILMVGGELSHGNAAPRRFVQNIVLNKQASKSFYVQSDIFQWVDKIFLPVSNPASTPVSAPPSQAPLGNEVDGGAEAKSPAHSPPPTDNGTVKAMPPKTGGGGGGSGQWNPNGPPRYFHRSGGRYQGPVGRGNSFNRGGRGGGGGNYRHHYNNNKEQRD